MSLLRSEKNFNFQADPTSLGKRRQGKAGKTLWKNLSEKKRMETAARLGGEPGSARHEAQQGLFAMTVRIEAPFHVASRNTLLHGARHKLRDLALPCPTLSIQILNGSIPRP